MVYFSEKKSVTLTNGLVLQNEGGWFPPLQDIAKIEHACDICPVRVFCKDNNEFDCQVYGMFYGFYFGIDDALDLYETIGDVQSKHKKG